MDIVIHTHHRTYRSTDHDFDFKLWYVFIKDAFSRYTTEEIEWIEQSNGWIELNLDQHPHPDRNDYVLKHVTHKIPDDSNLSR